jgi:hypothetical protein
MQVRARCSIERVAVLMMSGRWGERGPYSVRKAENLPSFITSLLHCFNILSACLASRMRHLGR